jgi:Zn-dependent protease with chaperone function
VTDDLRKPGRKALALLFGFYALTFGTVTLLIGANLVLWLAGGFYPFLAAITVVTTLTILPAVFGLDRRARDLQREGALPLSRAEQPQLWQLVDEIAAATGSQPPRTLLLDGDVNASVLESGTLLGLRPGKRYMVLGMPLLTLMNENELRAVLAHEFGHYVGGDTKVGAILYRAGAGLNRVVTNLRRPVIRSYFEDYAQLFAKVSFPIRRAQELNADRLSVAATNADDVRDALSRLPGMAAIWDFHRVAFLVPAWKRGLSVTDPFSALLPQWEGRTTLREEALARELKREPHRFDSHPSLADRLAALPERTTDPRPERGCLHLLQDAARVEASLRRAITPALARAGTPRDVTFADLPQEVAAERGDDLSREVLNCIRRLAVDGDSTPGTLGHLLDLLQESRGGELHERVVQSRRINDPRVARALTMEHLVHGTLAQALVAQDLAAYVVCFTGTDSFTVEGAGAPFDLQTLASKAVTGGRSTASVRTLLKRRKVDLDWGPPAPATLGVGELAAQIAAS